MLMKKGKGREEQYEGDEFLFIYFFFALKLNERVHGRNYFFVLG